MLPKLKNPALLRTAITHRSYLNEHPDSKESYERLEFLGDAVLELAVSLFLYKTYPKEPEGVLTNLRSSLVNTKALAGVARTLKLGEQLLLSKGEDQTGAREHESLLADAFEAYIGAIYLDQGFQAAYKFIETHVFPLVLEVRAKKLEKDSKSRLQEYAQATHRSLPSYELISAEGPEHQKIFTVSVSVGGKSLAKASGASKQEAQQKAAESALEKLGKS